MSPIDHSSGGPEQIEPGKAVMNYPGAKARLAPWIIDHLPEHNTYVEVFGGSAAVLVHKPESINEVYNDIDDDLVEFFEVLRDRRDELLDWLRHTPYSRTVYNKIADAYHAGERAADPVVRAGRLWYLVQAGFNGDLTKRNTFSTSTSARGYPCDSQARNYHRSRERLEAFAERFQSVIIECLDWREVIDRYDSATTLFYIDPPYPVSGEGYYPNHDLDHAALVERLAELEGEAVISYGELPEYPDSWALREKTVTSTLSRANGEEKDCPERLLLTFDPDTTTLFQSAQQRTLSNVGTDTERSEGGGDA
ncbi:DNA adenine methylase [Halosimplex pelagicum]|uniref:site-specific DNA-methyltransferase (adenine-specific) n=1 Tax=Halosimplex pelagicum TaxID=869886 RepID=A0A7D5TB54_9EURY|nr:DNA adenine methylase [Halosimplex pelagicum]QLH83390.1 DNA adenine methylase [Halosimplex pelagicum]